MRGRTRFIHRQPAAFELRLVELLDRRARRIFRRHFDERESPRASRCLVAHYANRFHLPGLCEQSLQRVLFRIERQVPDEQLPIHTYPLLLIHPDGECAAPCGVSAIELLREREDRVSLGQLTMPAADLVATRSETNKHFPNPQIRKSPGQEILRM
jgi:hypothetical protein